MIDCYVNHSLRQQHQMRTCGAKGRISMNKMLGKRKCVFIAHLGRLRITYAGNNGNIIANIFKFLHHNVIASSIFHFLFLAIQKAALQLFNSLFTSIPASNSKDETVSCDGGAE